MLVTVSAPTSLALKRAARRGWSCASSRARTPSWLPQNKAPGRLSRRGSARSCRAHGPSRPGRTPRAPDRAGTSPATTTRTLPASIRPAISSSCAALGCAIQRSGADAARPAFLRIVDRDRRDQHPALAEDREGSLLRLAADQIEHDLDIPRRHPRSAPSCSR